VSSGRAFDAALDEKLAAHFAAASATVTRVAETATLARPDRDGDTPVRMVELKAVGDGFPFYGTLELDGGQPYTHALVRGFGALERPERLAQLGVAVGDRLAIGGKAFTIRGVIAAEPGRRLGTFSLGPRVIVDLADLEQTTLLAFGSRATYQQLAKVDAARLTPLTAALRAEAKNSFARVRSYEEREGDLGEDFGRAENYLSLVGLIVVVLGGVGVSSVTRVFVQQKLRSIAILRCLGARGSQVLAVYVAQVLALGVLGSIVGVAIAAAVIAIMPSLLGPAMTAGVDIAYRLTPSAVAQGATTGLLVSLLFALVPLLDVRHVKPSLLLRDDAPPAGRDWVRWAAIVAVGGALLGLTMWQAGSVRIGGIVAIGFTALAGLLYGAGVALIAAVRPLTVARWFPLRHAALQLTRPGGQVHLVLLTVGLGTFFILGVRALQDTLVREVSVDLASDAPDLFLLDIQRDQVDGVRDTLGARQAPGSAPARVLPVLRARVVGVQGRELTLENYEDVRGRGSLAREYTVTYRDGLESNERLVDGQPWRGPATDGEVSIEESIRDRFGIAVGDTLRFDILGRTVSARVSAGRHVDWSDTRAGGFMFVFRPGLLDQAPHSFVAFVRGPSGAADRARLMGELARGFPNVSAIDGREMLGAIKTVVDNVTLAVTVVGSLVVVSGLLILVGAVAMTKFRRVYEAAILKTLGATRQVIATMLLLEYAVLGALAGVLGAAGAAGLTWALSRYAFSMAFQWPWPLLTIGVVACGVSVAVVGVMSSWDVLQRRPLSTLRGQ
jgi:putative ABC transport system permease protein